MSDEAVSDETDKLASPCVSRPRPRGRPPAPLLSARLIVWGGVALGVAGVTAGTLLATRKLADAIADDASPRHPAAARPASARTRPRGNVAQDLTRTADDLSASLIGVAQALLSAFTAFRQVAAQANGMVREFSETADQVRNVMHGSGPHEAGAAPGPRAPGAERGPG